MTVLSFGQMLNSLICQFFFNSCWILTLVLWTVNLFSVNQEAKFTASTASASTCLRSGPGWPTTRLSSSKVPLKQDLEIFNPASPSHLVISRNVNCLKAPQHNKRRWRWGFWQMTSCTQVALMSPSLEILSLCHLPLVDLSQHFSL